MSVKRVRVDRLILHQDLCRLIPAMRPGEWADFLADVKERGVRVPLEVMPGTHTVIDGRCRLLAAREAGQDEVPVIDANLQGDDSVIYMLRAATCRQHLTKDQVACLKLSE